MAPCRGVSHAGAVTLPWTSIMMTRSPLPGSGALTWMVCSTSPLRMLYRSMIPARSQLISRDLPAGVASRPSLTRVPPRSAPAKRQGAAHGRPLRRDLQVFGPDGWSALSIFLRPGGRVSDVLTRLIA